MPAKKNKSKPKPADVHDIPAVLPTVEVLEIAEPDGKGLGRHALVLIDGEGTKANRLCDCPTGHRTEIEAFMCPHAAAARENLIGDNLGPIKYATVLASVIRATNMVRSAMAEMDAASAAFAILVRRDNEAGQ